MTSRPDLLAERRAELERRLAALSPEKRALLERSRGNGVVAAPSGAIPARTPGAPVPMSFAQELLWLLDRANPGMHGYNVPRTARLRGALDVQALQRALDTIVARHEVLRSTFDMVDGEPRQIVHEPSPVVISRIDLRGRPMATRDAEAVSLLRDLTRRPFDLTTDAQLRVTLVQLADDDHVLLLESHHVASDAWSRNILMRELSALYEAYHGGVQPSLAPVAVQYGDYAAWQRDTLRGERLDALLGYWREQLRDAPAVLELPTDRPRPATPSFEGDTRSRMLPLPLLEKLRTLSRANESTLFMTLLAAFDVLLARYSGQDDVVVGSPLAGRSHEGTDAIIGYFANTLVLRARMHDDPHFVQLLQRVRETALGAYEHQDVPYEKLVLEMQRDRAQGRGQLFQVMFTLQDAELRTMQLPGLVMEHFGAARGATKFDLSLFMHEQQGGLRAAIEFRTDLFDGTTVERMLAQLEVLLEGIVADPSARISTLPLLPAAERHTLLDEWAMGAAQSVDAPTLHELIAQQVARTPDAIAVESEGATPDAPLRRLTFRELDARATVLARYLATRGVGPDVGVGICIERSPELVVAMLGVLKAGGFYLPLDPDYPADRLTFMLEDARVPVLLTTDALRDAVPRGDAVQSATVVAIDGEWDGVIAAAPHDTALRTAADAHLAYVIYTSGSTGRPKGVMIPHRAVVNYVSWMRNAFPLGTADAVLQKAPASFDACIWEFFLPLVSGARLVMARPGGHQDPAYLLSALEKHDVTLLQLVPSQLQMMLETPGTESPSGLPRLRRLFLGGEALPSDLLTRLAAACPTVPVTNLYGPTEATVYATHWSVDLASWNGGTVPIGRPIANTSVYLLDAARKPVPIGVPGELCIGGVQVARGYLNRPELTAEKFIDDPFASRGDARLYRTGDRARYRADGTLEYLGRIDTQVKLRGFRVELGEIESALAALPQVQGAVVLVREDTPGDQRLVGYCIASPGGDDASRTTAALRQQLKATLPEFMVPSAFVWLAEWPMNANGKLDRKALPAPDAGDIVTAERVEPRTPTEMQLSRIWGDVLQRDAGITDDFFEVGGHSLLALRTLARVHEKFGVRVPLRTLFDAPTIEQLAARIDAMTSEPGTRVSIPRRAGDVAPMSYAQELLWVLQSAAPENAAYNIAEQWQVVGPLDVDALQRALDMLVQRHEGFRTTFGREGTQPVQRIGPATSVALQRVDLSRKPSPDAAAQAHARAMARNPFDLAAGPLLRAALLRTARDTHVLVLVTHHIVYDGWSRGVLQRDLSALYDAARSGMAPALAPLPIRFADFAAWQRETLAGDALDRQLAYWREQLGGHTLALDLPTDRPRPASPGFEGAKQTVMLPVELLNGLQRVAREHDATLYMVLLGAFQALLHRYGGQEDITVATVVAGRDEAALEPLIGYFVNTLALRTSFADDPTVAALIERVRATQLGAIEHSALPFEMLATALGEGAPVATPNVMFVLQNNAASSLALGDAQMRAGGVDAGTAKFDLFLSMGEAPNGLRAALQYRTELFDHETATRMLGHLRTMLEAVVRDQDARVSELPLLTPRERTQLLVEWNDTAAEFPQDATMFSLVAAQARATPDRVAVSHGPTVLTYAELMRRSGILANALRSRGIAPGAFVGVCMERSADMIVALLAVLEAGGAYVPLDPAYPEDRVAFMLEDTRASVVLTESRVALRLPALVSRTAALGGEAILLDEGWVERLASPTQTPAVAAGPRDLAYIIYTSGSTGRPKGVMIEHRSAVAFITWARSVFGAQELARVLASTSICFDLSVFEIFVPLATGNEVVVVADALAIGTVPAEHAPTLINSVPSAAAELVRLDAIPPTVRTINLAGEPLAQRLVEQLYDVPTVERVYDLYGPSEDTTYSTYTLRTRGGRANIGRPVANTRVYVLDRRGEPVPVGVPGELFIAGDGLARGYLRRDELTAERFVPDPFSREGGGRMYRTGDLVRYLRDGRLEYFGRLDNQVKLRGFRIELGEVESVMAADDAVAHSVAMVQELAPGDSRLVAYVAPKAGATLDLGRIRAAMRRSLPTYMMPSAFVTMEALPLTQNGKIDRKRLPLPALDSVAETPYVAPRTPTEEGVAAAWREVLKRDRVGVLDHFFELGGHSLMAMRIVSRVQEAFGVRLPLNAVLEWPTVEQLAGRIDERRAAGAAVAPEAGIGRVARVASRRATSPHHPVSGGDA